jgi:predicted enzyme related to lactoylglutathione lyase
MADSTAVMTRSKIAPWAYVLAVHDIDLTARYFRDKLGFTLSWPEAPDWRLVQRDGVRIMLGKCPNEVPATQLGSHNWFAYLDAENVDDLHREFSASGAIVLRPPTDTSYGMREVTIATPDGHRVVFGQDLHRKAAGA